MHFMLFPPTTIKGTAEKELNLTGVESLKSFRVTPEKISFTLEEAGEMQTIDVITFNTPVTDVNFRRGPDDDFPLELMPMATIEFLEAFVFPERKSSEVRAMINTATSPLEDHIGYAINIEKSGEDVIYSKEFDTIITEAYHTLYTVFIRS